MNLENETIINVVALLKGPVGASRDYPLHRDAFSLDDEAHAEEIEITGITC